LLELDEGYYSAQLHPGSSISSIPTDGSQNGWIAIDDVTDYGF